MVPSAAPAYMMLPSIPLSPDPGNHAIEITAPPTLGNVDTNSRQALLESTFEDAAAAAL
jgi:hypothetical protein